MSLVVEASEGQRGLMAAFGSRLFLRPRPWQAVRASQRKDEGKKKNIM